MFGGTKEYEKAKRAAQSKGNWQKFQKNRHKIKTESERRAEREASYKKYQPNQDSNFHPHNRGYN